MAIYVNVQYNGGLLPDIILLTQCYYYLSGNTFKFHEEILSLQFMIPPKRCDISPPLTGGCSEGLDAYRFSFKQQLIAMWVHQNRGQHTL